MRVFVVLLLLVPGMVGGELRADGSTGRDTYLSLRKFQDLIPGAGESSNQDGACHLMRWNGCRIIAVVCPYDTEHVPLLFVNADKKEDAVKTAQQIAKMLPCSSSVRPFERREPWVAIICPCLSESQGYTPNVLLYPDGGRSTRFIGWQGKLLRAQVPYEPAYSRGKRRGAVVEIVLDITVPRFVRGEFRSVKGRMDDDEIRDFIGSRMSGVSSYLPEFSGREKRAVREKFPGYEILAYSTASETCVIRKSKTYHAGSIDQVSDYIASAHSDDQFEYPEVEISEVATETEKKQPQKSEKALAAERQSPERQEKTDVPQEEDGDEELVADHGVGKRGDGEKDHAEEPPPRTTREAIDRYIQFLNEL